MAPVQGRKLRLSEALDNRQHRSVDEADRGVGVAQHNAAHALVVFGQQVFDVVSAINNVIEQDVELSLSTSGVRKLVDFDKYGRGNYQFITILVKQITARPVGPVSTV